MKNSKRLQEAASADENALSKEIINGLSPPLAPVNEDKKQCTSCLIFQSHVCFYRRPAGGKALRPCCKQCVSIGKRSARIRKPSKRPLVFLGNGVVEVPLTQGKIALIDEADAELVSEHSWCVQQYKDTNRGGGMHIYAKASIGRTQVALHRFITKAPKGALIDHVNGNSLDNRRCNLRIADKSTNAANSNKARFRNTSSKYKGVFFCSKTNKWRSSITVRDRKMYLGVFDSEEDAAKAYNAGALKYFGEFAKGNVI